MTESCSLDGHESKAKVFVVERRVMKRNVAMAKAMVCFFLINNPEKIKSFGEIYVKYDRNKNIYIGHPQTLQISPPMKV